MRRHIEDKTKIKVKSMNKWLIILDLRVINEENLSYVGHRLSWRHCAYDPH